MLDRKEDQTGKIINLNWLYLIFEYLKYISTNLGTYKFYIHFGNIENEPEFYSSAAHIIIYYNGRPLSKLFSWVKY